VTTAFNVLHSTLVAALLQAPQITGERVYKGRARPLPAEHASSINISIEALNGEQFTLGAGPVLWEVVYAVEMRARGSATVDAADAADALLEAAYARILATAVPAGVEGWVITPRVRHEVEEADTPIGSSMLAINVRLRTQPGTLTLAT
jgi:hypothetical protein